MEYDMYINGVSLDHCLSPSVGANLPSCIPLERVPKYRTRDYVQSTVVHNRPFGWLIGVQRDLHPHPNTPSNPHKVQNAPEHPNDDGVRGYHTYSSKTEGGRGGGGGDVFSLSKNQSLVQSSSPGAADFHYYQPEQRSVGVVDSARIAPPFLAGR